MKILCDVCGGELEMSAGGNSATCKQCGMPHSLERVREKLGVSVNPQVDTTSSEKEKEAPIEDAIIEINDIEVIEEDVIDIDDIEVVEEDIIDIDDIEVVEEDVIDIDDIEVIEEDATLSAAYYLADIPEEELAKLEGRVGNYFLNKDARTADELHKDIAKYLGNSVFSRYEIAEHVPATFFGADENCMSIDFLLKENGVPILAFAILRTAYRRRSHQTIAGTIDACRKSDIKYTDVFVGLPNTEFYVIRKILKEIQ